MSANNSISQLLEQFIELYNNSLSTFEKTNEAITTDKETVAIDLYDPKKGSVKTVQIPSFGFLKREIERLDILEKSNQNIYFFEHIESGSILNILPTKYVLFNKQDATYMLSIVNSITKQNSPEGTNLENIAAEFKKSNSKQIFKAIYKFRIPGYEIDYYKYVYFISHNRKSALINLETPILTNFDEYIFKMKL